MCRGEGAWEGEGLGDEGGCLGWVTSYKQPDSSLFTNLIGILTTTRHCAILIGDGFEFVLATVVYKLCRKPLCQSPPNWILLWTFD